MTPAPFDLRLLNPHAADSPGGRRLVPEVEHLVPQAVALLNAAAAVDSPWVHPTTVATLRGRLQLGWEFDPPAALAGVVDDEVVALAEVHVTSWDNPELAWFEVVVHPAYRRRGLGHRLLDAAIREAAALGRTKRGIDAWDGTEGVGFAERHGFVRASQSINRRQHLAEVAREDVQRWHDEAAAAAAAYELLHVTGASPPDLLAHMSAMIESINDAPLDDLDVEDEVFPPDRIAAYERCQALRGHRLHRIVARHRATGELAGHTVVVVEEDRPDIGHQHDTTVVRRHRGHRLGLLLKCAMILHLGDVEPQLRTIDTWNAESNDHMVAVNELLGYRWMGREIELQQRGEQRR